MNTASPCRNARDQVADREATGGHRTSKVGALRVAIGAGRSARAVAQDAALGIGGGKQGIGRVLARHGLQVRRAARGIVGADDGHLGKRHQELAHVLGDAGRVGLQGKGLSHRVHPKRRFTRVVLLNPGPGLDGEGRQQGERDQQRQATSQGRERASRPPKDSGHPHREPTLHA